MVIRRRDLSLKSHPKDWRSPGSNSRSLVYKSKSFTTSPRRLLLFLVFLGTQMTIKWLPHCFLLHLKLSAGIDGFRKIISGGVETSTRKSQARFQINLVSSSAEPRMRLE